MKARIPVHIALASIFLLAVSASAQEQRQPYPAGVYTPSAVVATEDKLNGKRVSVEGVLENKGKNYFTDRRLVVVDTGGSSNSALPVKAWLPAEFAPGPAGHEAPTPVLSDYLGKTVILFGTVREDALKGFGKVKFLDVDSARIVDTALIVSAVVAEQNIDFSKVEIKTTDLGNKTYMLEGQGGNITVAVGTDGIIMVDTQFAPLSEKIKAAIKEISPLPIKYIINTHFHGDHTGGNANFQKDGAIVISQDNIRLRLAAGGNKNGTTGQAQPPAPAGGVPTETYSGGETTIEVGGRKAILHHVNNAHTDGDTWVYFPDANVIATGDVMNNRHRYQQVDWANGGDIRGVIRATNDWLAVSNDQTKVVVGHGPLANKQNIADFNSMVKTARERIEKLVKEGKTEEQVIAAKPLADLDKAWSDDDKAADNFAKQVYHSFTRS